MKIWIKRSDSLSRRIASCTLELHRVTFAALLMIGGAGSLAGCQNPPQSQQHQSSQATGDRTTPQNDLMSFAELERTRAEIARELDTAVREGRLSSRQADRFKIKALQTWLADENASRRLETDRLRLYRSLVDGVMAGTLSGREAVSRLGAFNVMDGGDPKNNWVSGVWVERDSVLFASASGEFARGNLGRYTIEEDGTVEMALPTGETTRVMKKQRQEDGTSKFVTVEVERPAWNGSASRNAAGKVTLKLQPPSNQGEKSRMVMKLLLEPRDSATFSPDRWIVGFWNTNFNERPFTFCFFPDGSCTWTYEYGVYKVDGDVADLKMNGSRNLQRLALQDDGSARLSERNPGAGENRSRSGVTYTRKPSGDS